MKRFLGGALAVTLLLTQVPTVFSVGTYASSAIVMDAESGRVLFEQDAHRQRLIASITKLMTALVALESGHSTDELVTIAPAWVGVEGSSIYLRAGEQITLEGLLYGMLLRSGNDAATAVAGYCAGDVDTFVVQMNEKARVLGMTQSHFANPSGLNADEHYSTAYDMDLLARACLQNEALAKIVATKSITLDGRNFTNHNKLLWRYEGCIGMKTGYTEKAGRTLISAAQRNGLTLICVTLNDPNDWADHTALFNDGFARYHAQPLAAQGAVLARVPVSGGLIPFCMVVAAESASVCLQGDEAVRCELELNQTTLIAPVAAGEVLGEAVYYLGDEQLARLPLLAGTSVAQVLAPRLGVLMGLRERLIG